MPPKHTAKKAAKQAAKAKAQPKSKGKAKAKPEEPEPAGPVGSETPAGENEVTVKQERQQEKGRAKAKASPGIAKQPHTSLVWENRQEQFRFAKFMGMQEGLHPGAKEAFKGATVARRDEIRVQWRVNKDEATNMVAQETFNMQKKKTAQQWLPKTKYQIAAAENLAPDHPLMTSILARYEKCGHPPDGVEDLQLYLYVADHGTTVSQEIGGKLAVSCCSERSAEDAEKLENQMLQGTVLPWLRGSKKPRLTLSAEETGHLAAVKAFKALDKKGQNYETSYDDLTAAATKVGETKKYALDMVETAKTVHEAFKETRRKYRSRYDEMEASENDVATKTLSLSELNAKYGDHVTAYGTGVIGDLIRVTR
jgi:hypothetical protein